MARTDPSHDANPATEAAGLAARDSYGRLLSLLAARSRDICAAEDALSEAFVAALEVWPRRGIPDNPEAWLLVTARRQMLDGQRREGTRQRNLLPIVEDLLASQVPHHGIRPMEPYSLPVPSQDPLPALPDERLTMMFVCAHPAIDSAIHTPLILQAVLGLDTVRIASAFLVPPATMAQRLLRAKTRIRDVGLSFVIPEGTELAARLEPVLQAIYAAYSAGWDRAGDPDGPAGDLGTEALFLARTLARSLPGEPEVQSLLALLLYCQSRVAARRGPAGIAFVPLERQNPTLWNSTLIQEAEAALTRAATLLAHAQLPGRFQIEASIQSAHIARRLQGLNTWPAILEFYGLLQRVAPSTGAAVAHAGALVSANQPSAALALLGSLPESAVRQYQPYWAVLAHASRAVGDLTTFREAAPIAIGLALDPGLRDWLQIEFADPARIFRP